MNRSRVAVVAVLFVLSCFAFSTLVTAAEKKAEWKPLMDGKTLKGWHPVGDGKWTVEEGAFVGRADNEKLYGLLVSDEQFIWEIKKDWYGLDILYLREHPESIFYTDFVALYKRSCCVIWSPHYYLTRCARLSPNLAEPEPNVPDLLCSIVTSPQWGTPRETLDHVVTGIVYP